MIRKFLHVTLIVLLLGAGAMLFLDLPFGIPVVKILIIISFILSFFSAVIRGRGAVKTIETETPPDEIRGSSVEQERILALEEEKRLAEDDAEYWKNALLQAYTAFRKLSAVLPVTEKLSSLITVKSERSTIDLTENIFSIADVSDDVSKKIHSLLEEMTAGDRSMAGNIKKLEQDIDAFARMEESFVKLIDGYKEEIHSLSNSVRHIKEFTESLTDLSERTHILAINASVEAARVGSQGAGFSVIAGEVQKLAANSKEIAARIKDLIGRIDGQVNVSFKHQVDEIDHAVRGIQQSKNDVGTMIQVFAPQAKIISETIAESERLSENVTEKLNKITVSLQFQDYIRQIIEHIIAILYEQNHLCDRNFPGDKFELKEKTSILEEEIKKNVEKYFTIREEWEILGLPFQEKDQGANRKADGDTQDLSGDVVLF